MNSASPPHICHVGTRSFQKFGRGFFPFVGRDARTGPMPNKTYMPSTNEGISLMLKALSLISPPTTARPRHQIWPDRRATLPPHPGPSSFGAGSRAPSSSPRGWSQSLTSNRDVLSAAPHRPERTRCPVPPTLPAAPHAAQRPPPVDPPKDVPAVIEHGVFHVFSWP